MFLKFIIPALLGLCVFGQQIPQPDGNELKSKIENLVNARDADQDGSISAAEAQADVNSLDADGSGDVSQSELSQRLTSLKFSPSFASYMFRNPSDSCQATVSAASVPARTFASSVIECLTSFCESGYGQYFSNNDCNELPGFCLLDPNFGCSYGCAKFLLSKQVSGNRILSDIVPQFVKKQSFVEKFQKLVDANDQDGDGQVTGAEFERDTLKYDISGDGCIDETEFVAHWMFPRCGGYGTSQEFAKGRFNDVVANSGGPSGPCNGIGGGAFPASFSLPTNVLIDRNIMTLINTCNSNCKLFKNNEDCKQLLEFCSSTKSPFASSDACKYFVNALVSEKHDCSYSIYDNSFVASKGSKNKYDFDFHDYDFDFHDYDFDDFWHHK